MVREIKPSSSVDRLPPHSVEAEQGVLGCLLQDPSRIADALEKLRWQTAYYDLRHQRIWNVLTEMWDNQRPIDLITVQQELKDRGELDGIGGITYLSQLIDCVPSAANLDYYIEIVRNKYIRRRVIQACTHVVSHVYENESDESDEVVDIAEREILKIGQERVAVDQKDIKTLVRRAIDTIEQLHQAQGKVSGLETGFPDFDKMTSGLHGGEMVVIAARPSMGKTSYAMNIAEHVACELKVPVGVFSLEMTADSLVTRMICSRARVNLRNVRDGFLCERDFPKITTAASRIAGAPLVIDDESGLSILQLRTRARRMAQRFGIKLLVVDYLQLLSSTNRRSENRQQEIADISNGIKSLAKELNVPIIVLSQLNREIEKERNRKPRLSDLRESGAIEQDADLVGLLYKPSSDDDEPVANPECQSINLYIAKQRNGPTGDVNLTFLRSYTRFESAAKVSAEDIVVPYND